jgi:HEAT repeat protein
LVTATCGVVVFTTWLTLWPQWQQYRRVQALVAELKNKDHQKRQAAVSALRTIGPPAVPSLERAVADEDRDTCLGSLSALEGIGREAFRAVPAIIEVMRGDDPYVRAQAARVFCRVVALGPDERFPALAGALRDRDAFVRETAVQALMYVGPEGKPAIPALVAALKDQSVKVRLCATVALGEMGAEARDAVPSLVESLQDRDPSVRWWASEALAKIDPDAAAPHETPARPGEQR